MPNRPYNRGNDTGSVEDTRRARDVSLANEVLRVVPGLAKRASKARGTTICPFCQGPKSRHALKCRACNDARMRELRAKGSVRFPRNSEAQEDLLRQDRQLADTLEGGAIHSGRHGRGGTVRPAPRPGRYRKLPDGTWDELE